MRGPVCRAVHIPAQHTCSVLAAVRMVVVRMQEEEEEIMSIEL